MSFQDYRSEIAQYFTETVATDDTLVNECVGLCKMYNLTVESLSYKWQAVSYSNTRTVAILTHKSIPDLKAKVQQDANNVAKQDAALRTATGFVVGKGRGRAGRAVRASAPGASVLNSGLKIGQLPSGIVKSELSASCRVVFKGPRLDEQSRRRRTYRYMHEKVTERSEALDDRIDEFADLIQKCYQIDELADPWAATEETTTIVGRIVHDADVLAPGTKLNDSSLVLESSRMMGSGVRIPIRFSPEVRLRGGVKGIGGTSFFPGAIVALRGRNGGGGFYLVEEVLALPPFKTPPSPPSDADASFSMCIACGPFSLDSDLSYKPWTNLVDKLKASKPAVVLLVGPFVDVANSRIMDGDTDKTPKQLFEQHFSEVLERLLVQSPDSLILLIPSVADLVSDHAVFPQCELEPDFSKDPRVRLLPNPCRFSVNGVLFGVTSVDTLFHLRKEEFFKRTQEVDPVIPAPDSATDSMANLSRIVLQQRSFYPLFPPPLEVAHEVNLDVTHSDGTKLVEGEDEYAPDILILPSRLKQFSKVVDSTMVINPSFLSKGPYAMLSYDGQRSGLVKDRITADISRSS